MRGEQYFLVLEHKDGTRYRVSKTPVTLKEMDKRTTKYSSKKELVTTIINNTGLNVNPKDIEEVCIYMQPNSKKEEYKKEKGPLYKKDIGVLDTESVGAKFELMLFDRSFVKEFIKKYKGIKNFNGLVTSVEVELNNNGNYMEPLSNLVEKIFSTYKGTRNAYLSIKKYKNTKRPIKERKKVELEESEESLIEQERLSYLFEHERELLDIDDFNHNKDISPFDAHKRR